MLLNGKTVDIYAMNHFFGKGKWLKDLNWKNFNV
jgi:hypothetical protein